MDKKQKKDNRKKQVSRGFEEREARAGKRNTSAEFEACAEQISPFGGLLGLINFLDLVQLEDIFDGVYIAPRRKVKLGNYRMVMGILVLLFIGFKRSWHFTYVRFDAIICGFFQLMKSPVPSTFWRCVDSLKVNQAHSFLKIMSVLRVGLATMQLEV